MSYLIFFHPVAEKEYQKAYQWYEEQLNGLGDRFEKAVEIKLDLLSSKPLLHPKKRGVFREANILSLPDCFQSLRKGKDDIYFCYLSH